MTERKSNHRVDRVSGYNNTTVQRNKKQQKNHRRTNDIETSIKTKEFLKKIVVKAEKRIEKKMNTLISQREDTKLLLIMGWQRELNWTIQIIEYATNATDQSEKVI